MNHRVSHRQDQCFSVQKGASNTESLFYFGYRRERQIPRVYSISGTEGSVKYRESIVFWVQKGASNTESLFYFGYRRERQIPRVPSILSVGTTFVTGFVGGCCLTVR